MKRLLQLIAAGMCLCGFPLTALSAPVKMTEEQMDGRTVYRLENYRVNLVVDPARGGAVVSYKDKLGGNVELIPKADFSGLGLDHFQAQSWPGELLEVPYEATVIQNSPTECILQVTRVATGEFQLARSPELEGVLLEKRYSLKADSPALECRVKLTAPAKSSSTLAYWLQNVFWSGGTYEAATDWSFRPSSRGVRAKSKEKPGLMGLEDFMNDFNAGWIAQIDKKTKSGLVFLSDYNSLKSLYVSQGNHSSELMFNMTYLPAGASVEFTTKIVPVAGLENVTTANEDFVAGSKLVSDNKGGAKLTLEVVRSANPPRAVSLDVSIKNVVDSALVTASQKIQIASPGDAVKLVTAAFTGAGTDPLVLQAKETAADGAGTGISFEEFYPGAYSWGENINTDMSSPVYKGVRPEQKVQLLRPSNMALLKPGQFNVLFIDGLLDDRQKITEAVNLTNRGEPPMEKKQSFTINNKAFGNKITFFPYNYEDLLSFNYIILGGAKADAVGPIGMEMLADFQKAGGGMILLGGPEAYGKSGFAGTKIEALLPVTIKKSGFDFSDVKWAKIEVAQDAPFLEGLGWDPKPLVRYVHDVEVKPWGKVILTAAGKPFLVIGQTPTGARVACFLGAPMGDAAEARGLAFWEWNDWLYLVRQVAWWVARHDDKFVLPTD